MPMECHIKSLLSPWEAVARASNATCPECEQRVVAQPGGRGCRGSNFNPSLDSPWETVCVCRWLTGKPEVPRDSIGTWGFCFFF